MSGTLLYLSAEDVGGLGLGMEAIIEALESMFVEKGRGGCQLPPKPGIYPRPDAFIHAMPAYVGGADAAGMKWVAGYPGNRERGLPYVSGLLILNDPDTGLPITVMDATWITAKRTGAATAVAARRLARPDATCVGILGCGVQGRSNLEALACVFDVQRVLAYDVSPDAAARYAEEVGDRHGVAVDIVRQPRDAVEGADVVVTAGPIFKDPDPTIEAGWLAPGGFACALDFDSYWTGAALAEADKLATDDRPQLEYYRSLGYFAATPEPYADLGEIVSDRRPGREGEEERIICLNLGLAAEDVVTARLIYERARSRGAGLELPL